MSAASFDAELARRIRAAPTLWDYACNAILPPLRLPEPLVYPLPDHGSYAAGLEFSIPRVRPVTEIQRFTDAYFDANLNDWKYMFKSHHTIPPRVHEELNSDLLIPSLPMTASYRRFSSSHPPSSASSASSVSSTGSFSVDEISSPTCPPLPSYDSVPVDPPPNPRNTRELLEWMYTYPLRTVEAMCNIADFGYKRWKWRSDLISMHGQIASPDGGETDALLASCILSERVDTSTTNSSIEPLMESYDPSHPDDEYEWTNRFAVFMIPPWLMGAADFEAFVSLRGIRDFKVASCLADKYGVPAVHPLPEEGLWCTILDRCEEMGVSSFVLTSYSYWVFGGFTRESTGAIDRLSVRVSSVRTCISRAPTILQTFTFFVRSVEMKDVGLGSEWSSLSGAPVDSASSVASASSYNGNGPSDDDDDDDDGDTQRGAPSPGSDRSGSTMKRKLGPDRAQSEARKRSVLSASAGSLPSSPWLAHAASLSRVSGHGSHAGLMPPPPPPSSYHSSSSSSSRSSTGSGSHRRRRLPRLSSSRSSAVSSSASSYSNGHPLPLPASSPAHIGSFEDAAAAAAASPSGPPSAVGSALSSAYIPSPSPLPPTPPPGGYNYSGESLDQTYFPVHGWNDAITGPWTQPVQAAQGYGLVSPTSATSDVDGDNHSSFSAHFDQEIEDVLRASYELPASAPPGDAMEATSVPLEIGTEHQPPPASDASVSVRSNAVPFTAQEVLDGIIFRRASTASASPQYSAYDLVRSPAPISQPRTPSPSPSDALSAQIRAGPPAMPRRPGGLGLEFEPGFGWTAPAEWFNYNFDPTRATEIQRYVNGNGSGAAASARVGFDPSENLPLDLIPSSNDYYPPRPQATSNPRGDENIHRAEGQGHAGPSHARGGPLEPRGFYPPVDPQQAATRRFSDPELLRPGVVAAALSDREARALAMAYTAVDEELSWSDKESEVGSPARSLGASAVRRPAPRPGTLPRIIPQPLPPLPGAGLSLSYVRTFLSPFNGEAYSRPASVASGDGSTVWEGRSTGARTAVDSDEQRSASGSSPASSHHSADHDPFFFHQHVFPSGPGTGTTSGSASEADAEGSVDPDPVAPAEITIHPRPYRREFTPTGEGSTFSFKSSIISSAARAEAVAEHQNMEDFMAQVREQAGPHNPQHFLGEPLDLEAMKEEARQRVESRSRPLAAELDPRLVQSPKLPAGAMAELPENDSDEVGSDILVTPSEVPSFVVGKYGDWKFASDGDSEALEPVASTSRQ